MHSDLHRECPRRDPAFLLLALIVSISAFQCRNNLGPSAPAGPAWVVFTSSNSPLVNNVINAIGGDANGKVWFATDSGASAFSENTWTSIREQLRHINTDSNTIATVTSVAEDNGKDLWFTLAQGGVERYNPNGSGASWVRYTTDNGLMSNIVFRGAASSIAPGDIWFATYNGISRFTPSATDPVIGEWASFTVKEIAELKTNKISIVVTDNMDNSVWFGTSSGTVVKAWYDIGLQWADRTPPNNQYPITAITFDSRNNPWIGTMYDAWQHDLRHGDWTEYSTLTTHGKLPLGLNAIAVDKTGTVWFGTDGGLAGLRDTSWTLFTPHNSPLPSPVVRSLYVDYAGNLWIGTTGGIAAYNETGTQF